MPDPIDPRDLPALRALAGAEFGPGATVTLPSGRVLDAAGAKALTSSFPPAVSGMTVLAPISVDGEAADA